MDIDFLNGYKIFHAMQFLFVLVYNSSLPFLPVGVEKDEYGDMHVSMQVKANSKENTINTSDQCDIVSKLPSHFGRGYSPLMMVIMFYINYVETKLVIVLYIYKIMLVFK